MYLLSMPGLGSRDWALKDRIPGLGSRDLMRLVCSSAAGLGSLEYLPMLLDVEP